MEEEKVIFHMKESKSTYFNLCDDVGVDSSVGSSVLFQKGFLYLDPSFFWSDFTLPFETMEVSLFHSFL